MNPFDVLIIGAGPAGSLAAYTVCKSGVEVAILDKEKLPRYKVCGGGLQEKARRVLPFEIKDVVDREIFGIAFQHRLQNKFIRRYKSPISHNVCRQRFDHLLLRHAQEAGATLFEGNRVDSLEVKPEYVKVCTDKEDFRARVVIGADGANSIVRKYINPEGFSQVQMGIICELVKRKGNRIQEDLYTIDWGTVPGGYAWIFPKEETWTVGAMAPQELAGSLKGYLKTFLAGEGLRIEGEKIFAHPIPTRRPGEPISSSWGILAGDAAGLTDPFTGEGLYYALRSGQIAAQWARQALYKEADPRVYEETIDRELMPEIITAGKLRGFFNTFSSYIHNLYRNNDRLWYSFCEVLRGDRTLEGLRRIRYRPPQPLMGYIERFTAWYERGRINKFKTSSGRWKEI